MNDNMLRPRRATVGSAGHALNLSIKQEGLQIPG